MKKQSQKPAKNPFELPVGWINIDSQRIRERMKVCGFTSDQQLADEVHESRQTLWRRLDENRMHVELLETIANQLDTSPESLCPLGSYKPRTVPKFELVPPPNWDVVSFHSTRVFVANGVSYRVAKLQNQIVKEQFARGKFYDMIRVPKATLDELKTRLKRHPEVCQRLKQAKATRIGRNCIVEPFLEDTAWWVLDDWIEGTTLRTILESDRKLSDDEIKTIATEILIGLSELHQNKVAFREMTPDQIYVSDDLCECTLTDFELAKFLQDVPTVSGKWQTRNHYRARENLELPTIGWPNYPRTDIFSWAAIVIEMFTGDPRAEPETLAARLSDSSIVELLLKCRNLDFRKRPTSVEEVQNDWAAWTPTK
jgi:hypothetical protein